MINIDCKLQSYFSTTTSEAKSVILWKDVVVFNLHKIQHLTNLHCYKAIVVRHN